MKPLLSRLAVLACLGAACVTAEQYMYSAQKYDPDGKCLAAYRAVETVPGDGVGSVCAPLCLSVGTDIYVSTMCPPLPTIATPIEADAADCIAALEALRSGTSCGAPPVEAGPAEAGEDAEADAQADAQADAADSAPPADAGDAG